MVTPLFLFPGYLGLRVRCDQNWSTDSYLTVAKQHHDETTLPNMRTRAGGLRQQSYLTRKCGDNVSKRCDIYVGGHCDTSGK